MVELVADLPPNLDALVRFVSVEDVAASASSDPDLVRLAGSGALTGALGEVVVLHTFEAASAHRLVLASIGCEAGVDGNRLRRAAAAATATLRAKNLACAAILLPSAGFTVLAPDVAAQAAAEGALIANHRFPGYATAGRDKAPLRSLVFAFEDPKRREVVQKALRQAKATANAVTLAQDLCRRPANLLKPRDFADAVEALAEDPRITVRLFDRDAIAALGMGAILAVARGSRAEPYFAELRYRPARPVNRDRPVVLVGKTVTFDSGGISLKPALDMDRMKADMGGGAAVLGAIQAAAALDLPVEIVGLFPIVENMPGGDAVRPGDVVATVSGKTVEIPNTDAEGRLILADALGYARTLDPDCIIDVATLTGASAIVFGPMGIGLFASDADLQARMLAADVLAGEKLWPLPLWPEYKSLLKSEVADLSNISVTVQQGSMMTAAAFLHEFAGTTPWAHLDIYNSSWNGGHHPYLAPGPTGSGTMTLIAFLTGRSQG